MADPSAAAAPRTGRIPEFGLSPEGRAPAPQPVKPVSRKDFAKKDAPDTARFDQIETYIKELMATIRKTLKR